MGNLDPPSPPNQGWENGAFWLLRDFILDLGGWGFAVPFYFVQDCSLLGPNEELTKQPGAKWLWTKPIAAFIEITIIFFPFVLSNIYESFLRPVKVRATQNANIGGGEGQEKILTF